MRVERIIAKTENKDVQADIDLSQIEPLIEKYRNKKGNLIPLLQGIQALYGYIPEQAFIMLSEETGIKLSDMYGVATFYAQFRLKPVGKYIIKVCHGTACHVQNATKVTEALQESLDVKDGETTKDGFFTLESVACLGCCSLAPVMMVGDETFGKLDGKESVNLVKTFKIKQSN